MQLRFRTWFAAILYLTINTAASATVTALFPGGGGTATVGNPSAGHYTVTLTRTDTSSGTIDALVTGGGHRHHRLDRRADQQRARNHAGYREGNELIEFNRIVGVYDENWHWPSDAS